MTSLASSVLFLFASQPVLSSSAASVRSIGLVRAFQKYGWTTHSAAIGKVDTDVTAKDQDHLQGVTQVVPNDTARITRILQTINPHVVVFDRMWVEEMFSHYVHQTIPKAVRILDTQDLHSLREGRLKVIQRGGSVIESLNYIPRPYNSPTASRELAAIHRSDVVLVCSTYEQHILKHVYAISQCKVSLAPFITSPISEDIMSSLNEPTRVSSLNLSTSASAPSPKPMPAVNPTGDTHPLAVTPSRDHFMTIGRHDHPPNADSLRWLCEIIWPMIRKRIPSAQLHIYGSHFPPNPQRSLTYTTTGDVENNSSDCKRRVVRMHDPTNGVHVKGLMESLEDMARYRVLLAPLRCGAGIKGKIADAWCRGLPVVTTPIGCEGMGPAHTHAQYTPNVSAHSIHSKYCANKKQHSCMTMQVTSNVVEWAGLCNAVTAEDFASNAVNLYTDTSLWMHVQEKGSADHSRFFTWEDNAEHLMTTVVPRAMDRLESRREQDIVQSMLWHHSLASSKHLASNAVLTHVKNSLFYNGLPEDAWECKLTEPPSDNVCV
eukprot:CFRG7264T1